MQTVAVIQAGSVMGDNGRTLQRLARLCAIARIRAQNWRLHQRR